MWRRWIIRGIFVLPILLCMGGWVFGGLYLNWIRYRNANGYYWIRPMQGAVTVAFARYYGSPTGWDIPVRRQTHPSFWNTYSTQTLGFDFVFNTYPGGYHCEFAVPYWFLIAGFSAVLFVVWRKTKPQPDYKTAFPIEAKAE